MKAKFIRDDMEVSFPVPNGHDGRWEYRPTMRNGEVQQIAFWKIGAVIEHRDCWQLVQHGCCIPEDEDCRLRANRTPEQMAAAQKSFSRLAAGIHPDDFELFDQGIIAGYLPDGSFKPGPNFKLLKEREHIEDDEESEDK